MVLSASQRVVRKESEVSNRVVTFFKDGLGEFRYRSSSTNGQPTLGPQEGYKRPGRAREAAYKELLEGRTITLKYSDGKNEITEVFERPAPKPLTKTTLPLKKK